LKYFLCGCLVWGIVIAALYLLRPQSRLHTASMEALTRKRWLLLVAVVCATTLVCILPMGLSPYWNGTIPDHRDQYERMAESMLNGHLYIDYKDIDPKLLQMENPYDPAAREALGVAVHWDHAFYNGHYYMYFGVVPVFLLFLPFRLLTGMDLTTFHATQIFVTAFICGVFALFHMLGKRFFKKMTLGMYLLLAAAFSMAAVWYSATTPALYCTAITAGLCMEIWSMYFFVRAVWVEPDEKKQIIWATLGSLFGALAFGCRPSLALGNVLVIPMLVAFLKKRTFNRKLLGQLVLAALPYVVIGVLLMAYNYVRFGSVTEFGQAYQMTLADQHGYTDFLSLIRPSRLINGLYENFISYQHVTDSFPYFAAGGAFVNFPILLFALVGLTQKPVRQGLRRQQLGGFTAVLAATPVLITLADVIWAPFLMERYRMDIYWVMTLLCFIVIGFSYQHLAEGTDEKAKRRMSWLTTMGALVTMVTCVILFLGPGDANYTSVYPEQLEAIRKVLCFGLG